MENTNDLSGQETANNGCGKLAFTAVVGVAIGAIGGYLFHRQFPKVGNSITEQLLLWTDATASMEPEIARKMGAYGTTVAGGGLGGLLGVLIGSASDSKSR